MTEVKNIDTSEFDNTACVVYPAQYPSNRFAPAKEDLHSTIMFLGDIDEDLNGMPAQDILDILSDVPSNFLQYPNAKGWALFGPDKNIPVVQLQLTDQMKRIHESVESALSRVGIESASEFGYSPHVTVDTRSYEINNIPEWVFLDRARLWYRGQKILIGDSRRAFLAGGPNDGYK